jgi:hypothetical protein
MGIREYQPLLSTSCILLIARAKEGKNIAKENILESTLYDLSLPLIP